MLELGISENDCPRTMMRVSLINHIRMNGIRSDLGIPNKITNINAKKRLK